jgi:glycosyltransferase involved in cell wall biosynthesis
MEFKYDFKLSIVIAVYYDEAVLHELHQRLDKVLSDMAPWVEIIFVDDGSQDCSFEILQLLQMRDSRIKLIKLARNFGQSSAITAGLDHADGDVIVIMDSDLQDRPEDIPLLIDAMLNNDVSMAVARWQMRKDSFFKQTVSNLFYYCSQRLTNLKHEPRLGVFRAIRRDVIEQLRKIPEKTGTSLSLLYWMGFNYVPVDLHRDARFAGTSGYTFSKMMKLTLDRILSYSMFPVRMATTCGLGLSVISVLFGMYFIVKWLLTPNMVLGWTSIVVLITLLFGMNFLILGLYGEYLGRIYVETRGRPKYIVEKHLHAPTQEHQIVKGNGTLYEKRQTEEVLHGS